ncbi:DNA polymerase III subunit alpha [Arthrospira platensis BEA 1257B]
MVRFGFQFWVENQEAIVQQLKTSGFTVDILSIDNE